MILLALSPIFIFMAALSVFKISSLKAAPGVLLYTIACALLFWKFSPILLGYALAEGVVFALWFIGIIVFAALLLSDLLERTGASLHIKTLLTGITSSLPATAVIVAWGLEGFLESIAGFGSGLVLPIVILTSMGLSPFRAAICALLANSMPTAYGGVGMGMTITSAVSGVPFPEFYRALNIFLFIPSLVIPFLIARCAASSWKEVWKIFPVPLGAFIGQRIGLSLSLGAALSSLLGAVLCFSGAVLAAKIFLPKEKHPQKILLRPLFKACSSFILAVFMILITGRANPVFNSYLTSFSSQFQIYPGGSILRFNWFTDPGIPLLLAALIGARIQGAGLKEIGASVKQVGFRLSSTIAVLLSIISLSRVMTYSGMIYTISRELASGIGGFYAALAPLLGAAGSFTTGSITASAVLMASLNVEMAGLLNIPSGWLVAGYNAGATASNMLTPHALAIVSAVLGTREYEHALMGHLIKYTLVYTGFLMVLSAIGSRLFY